MTSKAYFSISGIFIALYVLTSFGEIVGLPGWVHQACTVVFAGAAFLGVRKKKQEQAS
jgi:type III secretory pathway component EscV